MLQVTTGKGKFSETNLILEKKWKPHGLQTFTNILLLFKYI